MTRTALRLRAGVTVCALLAGALTGCSSDDGPAPTLQAFLDGWRSSKLDQVGFVGADGTRVPAAQVVTELRGLSGELVDTPPELKPAGEPQIVGDVATSPVDVTWNLPGGGRWAYRTDVRLQEAGDDGWRVVWEPAVVHADLAAGDRLGVRRVTADRATVLDAAGAPIVTGRPVVVVGVEPQRVTDLPRLTKDLQAAFASIRVSVDLSTLAQRVKDAQPTAFVDLISLRRPDFERIEARIRPLKGTVFRDETRQLAPTRPFARALLGTVDQATKEDLETSNGALVAGDLVGHGGLQQRYDQRLRGTVGESVVIVQEAPDGTTTDTPLYQAPPQPGQPLKTTLDPAVQNAADAALAGERRRSALVALRVTDGAVLAAANGPDGGTENLAFTARVSPGSTFKVVSTLGLLTAGAVTPATPVPCPKTITVDGAVFKNSGDASLGRVPFRTDFAESCNTAFAALAPKLGADGLARAGAGLGIGGQWELGIDAFSGNVATGGSAAEQAAAAFGQGQTVVSPLAMAGAVAAVAGGAWHQPKVLLDPAPAAAPAPGPLDAGHLESLRAMMREVVTTGTATALEDVPGEPVHGKTGTAEFETGNTETHAWFVGWQGDVAFAVFVEKGGAGADAAVPITEKFLRGLA
ncbi:penicillin-binding transpeptidase domain-containing protein [Spirilliplanes yamanashiensis]|uniref:Beta-lactamase n=1 Tax=Spirilliplanes yamanashiensis TaxID=42233 RepID=A0A8J3Y428_9ACTN|nr:penicillin-binding transpeptidase domain-containing protein [Spirilliplanes yamanashiensis]MDP9819858.1 cell division protein FtsI/penicillin-binding protein 2 [Spirilliplanes yamanashiensis]GIJ01323.1 cell division protein FtsI [Spirilliplanes yamanashiensis]